jgi:DUF4097 and DUF4098 domain-containing protein YvlB
MSLKSASPRALSVPAGQAWLLIAAALLGLAACDIQVQDGKPSFDLNTPEATEEWTRKYPLAPGGLVEVANLNGPIHVSAGDPGAVDVRAVITAKALTETTARENLSKGRIEETVSPGSVKVETIVPRGVRGSYEVRYEVRVPRDAQTQVSTTNGSVKADGVGGKLKVSVVNGTIELTDIGGQVDAVGVNGSLSARLSSVSAPVRLETTNGLLSLQLPSTSKANLAARVVNGRLSISGLQVQEPTGNRIRNLETVLNGGGPEIDLRTTNGRISITGFP